MRNRLASIWRDSSELMGKVAISIMQAKTEIKRPGWHRGSDEEKEALIQKISRLEKELEKAKVESIDKFEHISLLDTKFYNYKISLHYTEIVYAFTSNTVIKEKHIDTTLDELYKFVSLRISGLKKANDFIDAVSAFQSGYYVEEQDALIVRNKYEQLGLIETINGKDNIEMIQLTKLGREIRDKLNS